MKNTKLNVPGIFAAGLFAKMRIRIGKEKKSFVDSTKYVELCAKTNLSSHQILHSSLGFGWWESAHEGVREPTFSSLEGFARLEESDICGNWSGKQHHCHHLFPLKDDDAMVRILVLWKRERGVGNMKK